ncbi:MAG TPA: amidohydrolase family protein [Burkholderiaceae bacterium]|jgi:aminocarboxymuconate-semialdehyde decarboxylase|nr:amidohydrolase family protein [Burkholderiaceae bacterium]
MAHSSSGPFHATHQHGSPVDVHAHWYPKEWLDLLSEHGPAQGVEWREIAGKGPQFRVGHVTTGPAGARFVDLDARLQAMDEQGVAVHAMSLSQPMVYWADRDLGLRLSVVFNDQVSAAHEAHPQRLIGLATLPMQAPDLAVREVQRAAALPGIRGFYLATRVQDRELGDPAFFPVYEAIDALGLPIFLHPVFVIDDRRLERHYLTNLLGNPFESAIAAAHLIFGGVLDRFPRLTFVLPHAGGAFPWLVGRLHRGWQKRADLQHIEHGPIDYLRRFYYDTIGYSDAVTDYLVRHIGADRVLMGSDYCFPIAYEQPVEIVVANPALDAAQRHAILEGNARQLLRIG